MRIKDILDLELKLPSEGGYPEPTGEFTIWNNGYYNCKNYAFVDVQVSGAPNLNWQEATNDTLEFGDSLEGCNFIIVGETTADGVKVIYHEADYWDERDMAVWDNGTILEKIYDVDQLGDGLIVLNDGYNFVSGALYRIYWWC